MAWLQKRGGVWWIGWRHDGREFRETTGETERVKAQERLDEIKALDTARARDALTVEYFTAVTGRKVEKPTASKFLSGWLAESEPEVTHSTMLKYRQVVREFSAHIGTDSTGMALEDVTVDQVASFFAEKRAKLAPGTIKGYRRILSSIFLLAQNRGLIKGNPVALTKSRGKATQDLTTKKRPFTLSELNTLAGKATPFWRYMITAGYFSGQSLGDLITMRAETVDLKTGLITMHRRKTGKRVIIPLSKSLRVLLVSIWPKGGKGYFWPDEAARYSKVGASPFSQEFYDLMASAGMVTGRDDKKQAAGEGRSAKRKPQKLGFHNLRHTFVTHLKTGGAMDSVAKELAGHGSDAVSSVYTHLPPETLTRAINQLPEFVK